MKNLILDIQKRKKFGDEKPVKEELWSGEASKMNLICMKPGQEIKPHRHNGDHIWIVLEGRGEFLSPGSEPRTVGTGNIAVVPSGEEHGMRNSTEEGLVFASITV